MILLLPPGAPPRRRPSVIWVGGVPGAGKSTALHEVAGACPQVQVLDPDRWRSLLRRALPDSVGYPVYRPLVHLLHALTVLLALLHGPARGRVLLVHEPHTRPRWRRRLAALARRLGWHTSLLLIDVSRERARAGQRARGRVVGAHCFEAHWRRWCRLRQSLRAGVPLDGGDTWDRWTLVEREEAVPVLRRWCGTGPTAVGATRGRRRVAGS